MPAIVLSAKPGELKKNGASIEGDQSALQVLDGQHRLQAFSSILAQLEIGAPKDESGETAKKLKEMSAQELPVVIFEVGSNSEHRQMFAWFARNRPIEPAVREFFDESDPFGKVAKNAMEKSAVLMNRVTWKSKSVPPQGPESKKLLSLNSLKEIVTTVRIEVRQTPKPRDREACWQADTQQALLDHTVEFFDVFLPACQPNYEILDNLPELEKKILSERSMSYALDPPVIRLVANSWARWKLDRKSEPAELTKPIGQLNFRRADPGNDLEREFKVTSGPKNKFEGLRKECWETATTEIMRRASEQAAERQAKSE